jgi:hypothetical protein
MRETGGNGRSTLTAAFLLAALVALPYWRLLTLRGVVITDDVFTSDLMNEGFPYRHFLGQALKGGDWPTWFPHVYGGLPLLARSEAGVASPLNILLFGLLPPYAALNWVMVLTPLVAAWGTFLFARETGAGTPGSVLAGLSFAWSGFLVAHLKHLSMVGTVCWFPLALYLLERAARSRAERRSLCLFGVVVGLQVVSGHPQIVYYCVLFYIIYATGRARSVPGGAATLSWSLAALLAGLGLGAVQLLPTYELARLTDRAHGLSFAQATALAYDPRDVLNFFYPYANGDIGDGTYRGRAIFWEDYGYAGLIPLLLAGYGAVKGWRAWHTRFFAWAGAAAYLLVLGPHTPVFAAAFHVVPGMGYFRFPTRLLFLVDFSIAVLAAAGMRALTAREGSFPRGAALAPLLVGLTTLDLWYFQVRQNPVISAAEWRRPPRTAELLQQQGGPDLFRIYSLGTVETHRGAFGEAGGWRGSLAPFVEQRELLQPNSNAVYGLSSADGYAQLTPSYVVDIWGDQNRPGLMQRAGVFRDGTFTPSPQFLKILSLFNVKYVLSPWTVRSGELAPFKQEGRVLVYRNPQVLPRAFLLGRHRRVGDSAEAQERLLAPDFDPREEVILFEDPPHTEGPLSAEGALVSVERYRPEEVVVRTAAPYAGILVLGDTFYPGWRAEVDGVEVRILRANLAQRAVPLEAGTHEVRFVFRSPAIRRGLLISLVSGLAVAAALVGTRVAVSSSRGPVTRRAAKP